MRTSTHTHTNILKQIGRQKAETLRHSPLAEYPRKEEPPQPLLECLMFVCNAVHSDVTQTYRITPTLRACAECMQTGTEG